MSSYCLMNNIRINSSNAGPAWARLEEYLLNPPEGGTGLHEDELEKLKRAGSIRYALELMGWSSVVSVEGDIVGLCQTSDDVFEQEHKDIWSQLVDFIPPRSFFIFSGSDGNIFRWRFEDGELHEDAVERYIWNCDDVVILPRREVRAFLDRAEDGLNNLRRKIGST